MSVESDLKNLIVERYGTVKAFSQSVGLPNSTLDSIFRRGILKASVTNIIKICDELGISADGLGEGKIVARSGSLNRELVLTPGEADAIKKYRALDERGKLAVDSTLAREYEISSRNAAVVSDMASTISAADVALTGAAVKK